MGIVEPNRRISKTLIGLSVILIGLTVSLLFLTYSTNTALKSDAFIINSAGIVRGSIQRLTKLELSDCAKVCEEITATINSRIEAIQETVDTENTSATQLAFLHKINKLEQVWSLLNNQLNTYHAAPTMEAKLEVLRLSEYAWEIADASVLLAQVATETKMRYLKYFYPLAALIVIVNLVAIVMVYTDVGKKLEHQAEIDQLTNVYNPYTFKKLLHEKILESERLQHALALIYIDIDFFKTINDNYGHQIGDNVLREIGSLIQNSVRRTDIVARIGGEEFAIIAPAIEHEQSVALAEKIRTRIEGHQFQDINSITVSAGVAAFRNNMRTQDLIAEADKALYRAKEKGRNKVVYFPNVQKHT